jgi:hypothetical protein
MAIQFQKATKKKGRLRMGLVGPSGSGKTFTALRVMSALIGPNGRIAVIDSERGSASKYAGIRKGDVVFKFDVLELESFEPARYIEAIEAAGAQGYDGLIIDSLSHAWAGIGGALEMVDNATAKNKGNKFAAWRDVTPVHNRLVDTILRSKCHVIATMRAKTEWVLEQDERGKQVPRKIGLAPVQRDGMEYEFDVVGDLDDAKYTVTKTRCDPLRGQLIREPGEDLAKILAAWLTDGEDAPEPMRQAAPPAPPPPVKTAPANTSARVASEQPRGGVLGKQARLNRIWTRAKEEGVTPDQFKAWRASIIPTKGIEEVTDDDLDQLEVALPDLLRSMQPATDNSPTPF